MESDPQAYTVECVAFSPDGKRIVGAFGHIIKLWDANTGQEILTFKGHSQSRPVTSVAFCPDGKRIVSGSNDKTVKLWDTATGQETLTLKEHRDGVNAVTFSPDGNRIVSGGDDGIRIWDSKPMDQ